VSPQRIQLKRTKGWRMPANTVIVARPGKYGNRYIVNGALTLHVDGELHEVPDRATAKRLHREELEHWLTLRPDLVTPMLEALRGRNLACWCPIGEPCHADTLLEYANRPMATAPNAPAAP
jgi:hypothetical protein